MTGTNDNPNLADASDDDLKAMGLPAAFTLDELQAALSDEEIKRLAEGDDPIVKLPDTADEAKAGEGDSNGGDDVAGGEDGDSGGKDAAAADPGADAAVEDSPDPVYQPRDVTKAQAVVDSAAEDRKKLREAWDDGELSDDEYHAKIEEISDKLAEAKADIKDAERQDEKDKETVLNAWHSKVDAFLDANPAFRDNEPNPQLEGNSYLTALDTVMKAVNQDPRYTSMTMNQRIEASANIVRSYVQQQTGADIPGLADVKKPGKAKEADPLAKAKDKVAEQGKRPDAVQTLGNVTSATDTEIDNSRFASIDREKSALDREREFSRLSPEEQEAYLREN